MLVVMKSHATEAQVRAVCDRIESLGFKAHPIPGAIRTAIVVPAQAMELSRLLGLVVK